MLDIKDRWWQISVLRVLTLHRHHVSPLVLLPLQTFDLQDREKMVVYIFMKMNAFIFLSMFHNKSLTFLFYYSNKVPSGTCYFGHVHFTSHKPWGGANTSKFHKCHCETSERYSISETQRLFLVKGHSISTSMPRGLNRPPDCLVEVHTPSWTMNTCRDRVRVICVLNDLFILISII